MIGSAIIYSLSSGLYSFRIITHDDHIRAWIPNTDTPVIYKLKRLNKILKSQ